VGTGELTFCLTSLKATVLPGSGWLVISRPVTYFFSFRRGRFLLPRWCFVAAFAGGEELCVLMWQKGKVAS
jgi:hypothetical protein